MIYNTNISFLREKNISPILKPPSLQKLLQAAVRSALKIFRTLFIND